MSDVWPSRTDRGPLDPSRREREGIERRQELGGFLGGDVENENGNDGVRRRLGPEVSVDELETGVGFAREKRVGVADLVERAA